MILTNSMIWIITLTYICTSVLNNQFDEHESHAKKFKSGNDLASVLHDHSYTSILKDTEFLFEEQLKTIVVGKYHDTDNEKNNMVNGLDYMNLFTYCELNDEDQSVSKMSEYDDFYDNGNLFEHNMADLFLDENTIKDGISITNESENYNAVSFGEDITCNADKYDNPEANNTLFVIPNDQKEKFIGPEQNIKTNYDCVIDKKDDLSFKEKEEIFKEVYDEILRYIMNNFSKTQYKMYIARLEGINYALKALDNYELNLIEYKKMYVFSDINYINEFEHLSLGKNNMFDQSTRHDFFYNLESNISKSQKSRRREFFISAGDKKQLYFIYEFIKLYKYIDDIPEILAIGCLLNANLFSETVNFLHLINLFIEKKGIKDRSFIMCLIDKVISCSSKHNLNILSTPKFHLESQKTCHDLGFFLWELDTRKRRDIMSLISLEIDMKKAYACNYMVNIHFKLIFLLYLYQHLIFMKYHNISLEDVKTFKNFIDEIRCSEKCFGHYFDKYLNVLKKQLEML